MARAINILTLSIISLSLCSVLRGESPLPDSASLPLEHRSTYGLSLSSSAYTPQSIFLNGGAGPSDESWPLATPDMPQIKHLQVQCEKTHMRVNIEFDRPFYGMIFSKGFYSDSNCVHLKSGTGHLSVTFEIFLNSCGMSSSANHNAVHYGAASPSGSYVENTIIIQYDPYVQEVWDQARKLRCTWYDFYEKAVTFRPFQVDMLHAVTANFLGDNLQCWMQIQVGKGPWASEVSGIVKIGQTMTMVLAIKDDENKFDMLVRNCVAHDGKRAPIQLVDQYGCVVRPKIMSRFQKIKNFGPSASVVSFAYFQAFKFPDSMNVHFQCVIQVCRYNCPESKCGGHPSLSEGAVNNPELNGHPNSVNEFGSVSEYGLSSLFLDPRHPSGPTGAYSDTNAEVLPPPQTPPPVSSTSSATVISSPTPQANDIRIPPPLSSRYHGQFSSIKRKNDAVSEKLEGNLATLGGRPRSVENLSAELQGARKKRDSILIVYPNINNIRKREAQEMTDVNTSRIIQVVAPGDVNFALNPASNNETVVIESTPNTDSDYICVSILSFVAGLVMLLLVLIVASLISAFLFFRVRAINRKGLTTTYVGEPGLSSISEFVKVAK